MARSSIAHLYTPHTGQLKVHESPAKVKVLKIGRRWGKGRCAQGELESAFLYALAIPAPPTLVPPFHAWVVTPSMPQGRQTWAELKQLIPKQWQKHVVEEEHIMTLWGNEQRQEGVIEVKSAYMAESLQTVGLDFLWINEAQDISNEAFEKLVPTMRSPDRMGFAVFEGIPSLYSDHWFERLYRAAVRGRRDYFAYTATTFENPHLSARQKEEIEEDRDVMRDVAWRRMYLAEFSDSAGYFSNADACIAGDLLPHPIPGRRYVGGLDLGRKVDPTVLNIMDAEARRTVYHRTWESGEDFSMIRESITSEYLKWELEKIIIDATGIGDVMSDNLREAGLNIEDFVISVATRYTLLNDLAVAIERETIHYPGTMETLLRQLRYFQTKKYGDRYRIEAPSGEHDDEVFALALVLRGCDAAQPIASLNASGGLMRGRYLPSQEEAAGGGISNSPGRQMMRGRQRQKQIDRWVRSNVPDAEKELVGG